MATIQLRRGTAAQWVTANPTLAAGEPGFETDTRKLKIGNGSTAWNLLQYTTDTWAYFTATWSVEPTQVGSTVSGVVFEYELNGTSRFRLVPDPYDATNDAFYSGWDGTTLTGLIVARG
jgi:hypothetical protein